MDEIARVLDTATPNQAIVISADDLDAHIENRDSDGEQLVAEAEVQAQERAAQSEAALAAATNPMAAVNSGV
jgi:hypothetical protein